MTVPMHNSQQGWVNTSLEEQRDNSGTRSRATTLPCCADAQTLQGTACLRHNFKPAWMELNDGCNVFNGSRS
jgi:hypothetical protein